MEGKHNEEDMMGRPQWGGHDVVRWARWGEARGRPQRGKGTAASLEATTSTTRREHTGRGGVLLAWSKGS